MQLNILDVGLDSYLFAYDKLRAYIDIWAGECSQIRCFNDTRWWKCSVLITRGHVDH